MIGLQNYLMKNNSMDQRIALQILGKLVRSFESNLLEEYLNVVKVHVHHQDIEVRRILLDIFSKQYLESGDDNIHHSRNIGNGTGWPLPVGTE